MSKNRTTEEELHFLQGAVGYLLLVLGTIADTPVLREADTKFNELLTDAKGAGLSTSLDGKYGAYWARESLAKLVKERGA